MTGRKPGRSSGTVSQCIYHLFKAQNELISYFSRLTTVLAGVKIRKVGLPSRSNNFVLNGTVMCDNTLKETAAIRFLVA